MYRKRNIFPALLFFCSLVISAQVTFSELPSDLQLITRNAAASGQFKISGTCTASSHHWLRSRLTEIPGDTLVVEEKTVSPGADGSFSILHTLPARLKEYNLHIYLCDSLSSLLIKTVSRLVCGDYFMICGQSNGLASADYDDTSNVRSWLRGIGTNDDPDARGFPCNRQSLAFGQASPGWLQPGFTGSWGMKLIYDLSEHTGIPMCLINGSRAGSSILQNLASHTPSDMNRLDSCYAYDRAYLKAAHNHVTSSVRAMFWYQGETDGDTPADSTCTYFAKFDRLYRSWKVDYPNLEKIFLMQVNTGCNQTHLSLLREIQREISYKYADIVILSTFSMDTAERLNDQCHYTGKGYKKLAEKVLPVVSKYIYNENLDEDAILPPKVVKAYRSQPAQLCIEFDKAVSVQQYKDYQKGRAYIKDYFYGHTSTALDVQSVSADGNTVLLNFNDKSQVPDRITYTPETFSNLPSLYTGPWIVNAKNAELAAISFYNFPVTTNDAANNWSAASLNGACDPMPESVIPEIFLAYPNPAKDLLSINFPPEDTGNNSVLIINEQGKIILQMNSDGRQLITLDVGIYEKGLYFVKVNGSSGDVFIKKMIFGSN